MVKCCANVCGYVFWLHETKNHFHFKFKCIAYDGFNAFGYIQYDFVRVMCVACKRVK